MSVKLAHKSYPISLNVIFKVDTGAPISTLTTKTLDKLYENCPQIERNFLDSYSVIIAGHKIVVQRSQAHYLILNILGAKFISEKSVHIEIDYQTFEGG